MSEAWLVTLTLLSALGGLIYLCLIWNFGHWRKRGVREAKSYALCGSLPSMLTQKRHLVYDIDEIYRKYRSEANFVGIFTCRSPQLLILDPELVHKIYVNDFKHFHENQFSEFVDERRDLILANNPFALAGEKWKERRNEITPGLTTNRIKNSYPVTLEVCNKLRDYIKQQRKLVTKDGFDINELCIRYTAEAVTGCVLGLQAESFSERPTAVLPMIKKLLGQTFMFMLYQLLVGLIPVIKKFYKVRIFPKNVQKFFFKLMYESMDKRRASKLESNDFLSYLLQLQDKKNLTAPETASHLMTYMTDGFLTTSTVFAHTLLGLARNINKQEKLREEILDNLDENGKLNFENVSNLPYLDACFYESLRLFPPVVFNCKICTEPYELTDKNGKKVQLNKNDVVMISTFSLHRDERFYSNPESFEPERFLSEDGGVREYRERGVFNGFGNGPRVCLGNRFALTQVKAGVATILQNFNMKINPKTRADNHLDKSMFLASLDGGIWINLEPRI